MIGRPSASQADYYRPPFTESISPTKSQITLLRPAQVRQLVENISQAAIQNGKEAAGEKVPQIVRKRQLSLRKGSKIKEVQTSNNLIQLAARDSTKESGDTFSSVAAEYFLGPIIGNF